MWSNDQAKSRFNGVVSTYSTFLNIWLVDLLGHFLDGQKKSKHLGTSETNGDEN